MPLAVTTRLQALALLQTETDCSANVQSGLNKDQAYLGSNLPKPVRFTEPPRATMSVISLSV